MLCTEALWDIKDDDPGCGGAQAVTEDAEGDPAPEPAEVVVPLFIPGKLAVGCVLVDDVGGRS